MKKLLVLAVAVLTVVQFNISSFAVGSDGFANPVVSARSMALGYTGVARTGDPAAAWFNPALATDQNGSAVQLGLGAVSIDSHYSGTGTSANSETDYLPIPNFYTAIPFAEKLAFTFGVNTPFGLSTKWPEDSAVRYDATSSNLTHVQFNPSLAFKLNEMLSFGAGIVYSVSDASLQKKVPVTLLNSSPSPDGNLKMTANGHGWGYNLGMSVKPAENHQIGVNYRSRIHTELSGTTKVSGLSGTIGALAGSEFSADTKTDLTMPDTLMLGYTYSPGKWSFELDGEYAAWSCVDGLNLDFTSMPANPVDQGLLAAGAKQDFDYHNTWNFAFGTNYKLNDVWDLRGGLTHFGQVGPDHTYTPAIPGGERNAITLGFGINKPSFSIDFGYDYTWVVDRTITAGETTLPLAAVGTYKTQIQGFSASYTYKWGGKS